MSSTSRFRIISIRRSISMSCGQGRICSRKNPSESISAARGSSRRRQSSGRFVRCSSEFPFLPGAQSVYRIPASGNLGRLLEIHSGFHHSSDLDPTKPINWKRQNQICGEIGVMGDLGMHAVHIPFRLGLATRRVYAQLQKIYHERPDGKGGMAPCDTWDNALLHTEVAIEKAQVPLRLEMKRLAPGETNTWFIEIFGTEGGVNFSTKEPKTLWTYHRGKEQLWERTDSGFRRYFRRSRAVSSSQAFPIASCRCGPHSLPSARECSVINLAA